MSEGIFWSLEEHLALRLLVHDIDLIFKQPDMGNRIYHNYAQVKRAVSNGKHGYLTDDLQAVCEVLQVPMADFLPVDLVKDIREKFEFYTSRVSFADFYLNHPGAIFAIITASIYNRKDPLSEYPAAAEWLIERGVDPFIVIYAAYDSCMYAEELLETLSVKLLSIKEELVIH